MGGAGRCNVSVIESSAVVGVTGARRSVLPGPFLGGV
jgi:hypothetical protein